MIDDLDRYANEHSGFDHTDIFGKGRIRKLIFEYNALKQSYQKETKAQQEIIMSQARAVTSMVEKTQSMQDEIDYLKRYIKESDAAKANLQKNRMLADSDKLSAEKRVLILQEENAALKETLDSLRADYNELTNLYESVVEIVKKERPDICLDVIAS